MLKFENVSKIYSGGKKAVNHLNLEIEVNLPTKNQQLIDTLRQNGYGVTVFQGEGMTSVRYKLEIFTKRNMEEDLISMIQEYEPNAFVISYEPRRFIGDIS